MKMKSLITGAAVGSLLAGIAIASSHREAPLIAEDPTVDSTDVYAFVSPDQPSTVTLLANYIPFQVPASGPNYHRFSDQALYEIKIDNTGDAVEDIVYQFRFVNERRTGATFLYNTGGMTDPNDSDRNVTQKYTVTRQELTAGAVTSEAVLGTFETAFPNIGPRSNGGSNGDYEANSAKFIGDLAGAGGKVFVGPRDEGFYLDINAIFDLLNITRTDGLGNGSAVDGTAGLNVSTIGLQIPITRLTADGSAPTDALDHDAVIGVWTTASRPKHKVIRGGSDPRAFGPYVQVSRLGLPLVNEVVVPLAFKDQYNRTSPKDDVANIAGYVVDPELSRLLRDVHGLTVPPTPRLDLVKVISFLPGALTSRADLQPADILRLNVAIPPKAPGDSGYSRLGVIGGDTGGFPNGRRVGDDVVDILERVVGGGILAEGTPPEATGETAWGDVFPNNALNDGVDENDVPYLTVFPYLGTPKPGL